MVDRFPKGLRRVVEDYGKQIEIAIDREVRWDSPLGCGSFGCVFPLVADPRRVLKLSTDPTEGPVVKAIMETGLDKKMHGLARWDAIWKVPFEIQEGPRSTCWVILREDVMPYRSEAFMEIFRSQDTFWANARSTLRWQTPLSDYNRQAHLAIHYKKKERKELYRNFAEEHLGEMYNNEETYYLAEAIEALGRNDIFIADVHLGNVGGRIHSWEYDTPSGQGVNHIHWSFYESGKDAQGRHIYIPHHIKAPALLMFDPGHSSAPKGDVDPLWQEPGAVLGECWDDVGARVNEV